MKLLTFAIPCYNSQDYMENCIKSLLPGGDDVEILIIDDGSKDSTGDIADAYEKKYPGIIRAIHQVNGGHGEAVNAGIRNATGLYFKVVDSDDWVDEEAYKKILDKLRELTGGNQTLDMFIANYVYEKEPEYKMEKIPVYVYENYTQSTSGDNSANDYGQVTYTAVKDIIFTNTSWNEDSVHLYVQNQQKIEKTQTALAILNMIDYADVTNLATLQEKYLQKAEAFIESKSGVITQKQQDEIKAQKDNLIFDKDNKVITLAGQEAIVYDINRTDSKAMLEQAYTDSNTNASSTENDGIVFEKSKLFDQISNNEDQLYKTNSTELLFQNEADTKDTLDYQLEVGSGNNKYTIKVTGDKVDRDYANTHSEGPGSTYSRSATAIDAKYAMYKTFQQRLGEDGFITTPNLKPYFVRMTNKSVSNSIKSKDDFDTNADSSATVRSAVADLGTQLQGILDKTSYDDSTYSNVTKLTSKDTSPFFTQFMETKSGGLTKLEGDDHTTYKGYKLYNSKDVLKTPSEFVNEYKKSYKFADVANKKYFDDNMECFVKTKLADTKFFIKFGHDILKFLITLRILQ